ncbi:hypothetical protein L249_5653 [Ophiocordyceps polyrhachis-furcata BCC 54312]|uniref:Uncharacterized protein n=1 Tax=Ophiocordyceps polyrhachis-furcata BCC 54312 TaxID=1330021 RepID=A0A367LGS9_9HYPO|nr:hypothetical protein L249_5653 [Ophiocordyceps polyrhachis-furcata BCC 54312]
MCIIWVSGPSSSCSLIRANASSDLFPMGIVIAARELGKSDFLSVGHDFSMRKNVGKKWVCLLKSVGKVESNKVFCGAVEEEEGGEKLVEMEMMISNQGVDHVIEKKKTNHVIVVFTTIEVGRYDRYWYSASIAVTITYSAPIDVTAALYSAPIAVTIAVTSRFGRYDRYSPTVTQGVVAGLRPNWYNLFQVALQAYFLSVQDEKICVI